MSTSDIQVVFLLADVLSNVHLAASDRNSFWSHCQLFVIERFTHQGQTAHTWLPSYYVQTQPRIPVAPSLWESYNPPVLQQLPQGPEGLKESWIQEIGLKEGSEKSTLEFTELHVLHLNDHNVHQAPTDAILPASSPTCFKKPIWPFKWLHSCTLSNYPYCQHWCEQSFNRIRKCILNVITLLKHPSYK